MTWARQTVTDCDDLSEPGILLDAVGSLSSFVSSANQKGCFADADLAHTSPDGHPEPLEPCTSHQLGTFLRLVLSFPS